MATRGNQPERYFLEPIPFLSPFWVTSSGGRYSSALNLARLCARGKVAEVEELLESSGLSVLQALDIGGKYDRWSCLIYACRGLNSDVISYLARKGSDLDFCSKGGMTPLIAIVNASNPKNENKSVQCAKILVDFGVNIRPSFCDSVENTYTSSFIDFRTGLTKAVSKGTTELVEFLLKSGVHPNLRDENGKTPFNIAVAGNMFEIADLLLSYGANPFMKNLDGDWCPDMADRIADPEDSMRMLYYVAIILKQAKREYVNDYDFCEMQDYFNSGCEQSRNNVTLPVISDWQVNLYEQASKDENETIYEDENETIYEDENETIFEDDETYEHNNSTWIVGGLVTFAVISIAMFAMKKVNFW